MSRLDSFIRRMSAQRDIINGLKSSIDDIAGAVFEFGLGSGRTYDHLREIFPSRRIVVFESVTKDMPLQRVAKDDLLIGDIRDTTSPLPDGCAALIHTDIETGVPERDAALTAWLPGLVARLLVPGGYAASSSNLLDPRLSPCPVPSGIQEGRYHILRRI